MRQIASLLACFILCIIIDEAAYKQLVTVNQTSAKKQSMQVTPVQLRDGTWALNADILEPAKGQKSNKAWSEYFDLLSSLPQREAKADEFIQNDENLKPGDIKPIPVPDKVGDADPVKP